ncbi:hypothetical protein A4X06_0g9299 [Tilletia controversa]|uniref:Uncharacterized protein n=6 Tax=Tilletia TaxID=13289 RepID=A0A8X7MIJ3_9BASI|nr:hypothetical protein CF328_g8811 [Tilletia controversa]KAE8237220.1 hypothetical protein A4X06_0g9299 [Tilletia controversa]
MQLRLPFVVAALVLITGAVAASIPQVEGLAVRSPADSLVQGSAAAPLEARVSKSQLEAKAVALAKSGKAQIDADLAKLEALQKQSKPSEAEARKAFGTLNSHLHSIGRQYEQLATQYHESPSSRDLVERQALLQPAIADLNKSLNKLLPQVRLLVRHLTTNLGLNTVSVIVRQITPGLKQIDLGLEQILTVLGDDLGPGLVDPLLRTVFGLLDGLGLNLNARDLTFEDRAVSKSAVKSEITNSMQQASSEFSSDYATFKKLLGQKKVTQSQFDSAVKTLQSHAEKTTAEVKKLEKKAQASGLSSRAQPGDLNTAVAGLIADLNKVLPLVDSLVHKVVGDLELNAVNQLVDALTPTLVTLIGAVEALLAGLAPGLSGLVNPLLGLVNGLTKSLGIDLNNDTGRL